MILEFLTISCQYQRKEYYLKHINEMINIELIEGDTYRNLFNKLQEYANNRSEDVKIAIEDFIACNKNGHEDSEFEQIICDSEIAYAAFNLIPTR